MNGHFESAVIKNTFRREKAQVVFFLVAKPENSFLKQYFYLRFYTKSNSTQQYRTQMITNVKKELGRSFTLSAPADALKEPQYSR